MIHKVLIANRGEIAVRIIRTCREMGIKTVAVYSTADRDAMHIRMADQAVCIGPPPGVDSYLNVPAILSAIEITDADAVHPGYGFLAENAAFAEICANYGVRFIGPSSEAIRLMGDKIEARRAVQKVKVPVVPGSDGAVTEEEEGLRIGKEIGFPVIVKAAAGGGGRGMKIVHSPASFINAFLTAQSEALSAFGVPDVYIEKYYDIARHVDSTVHKFEEWGLPIMLNPETGRYQREGKWQIMIHGESYKPIIAEAARKSASEVYNRIMVTHLLMDKAHPGRVAGAVGFSVRDRHFYVFRAKAVIVAAGGASHIFRPRSIGEGVGRTWYAPWSSASAYGLVLHAGAQMIQMENRIVLARFKDGYGPVGAWFLLLKAHATNAYGVNYEAARFEEMKALVGHYAETTPVPTCLRNHAMLQEIKAGNGPIYMHTQEVLDSREKEEIGWQDFLDMTVGQAVV